MSGPQSRAETLFQKLSNVSPIVRQFLDIPPTKIAGPFILSPNEIIATLSSEETKLQPFLIKVLLQRWLGETFVSWEANQWNCPIARIWAMYQLGDDALDPRVKEFFRNSRFITKNMKPEEGTKHGLKLLMLENFSETSGLSCLLAFASLEVAALEHVDLNKFTKLMKETPTGQSLLNLSRRKNDWLLECQRLFDARQIYRDRTAGSTQALVAGLDNNDFNLQVRSRSIAAAEIEYLIRQSEISAGVQGRIGSEIGGLIGGKIKGGVNALAAYSSEDEEMDYDLTWLGYNQPWLAET
ncbi:hypothetical protein MMC28_011081 [Mycoblastus sanguinarius]|nr:hypothetical protein [Mycoblastus sanguinarius]